jgi:hypothetical protein
MLRPGSESVTVPAGESFFRPMVGDAGEGLGLRLLNHPSRAACTVLSIGYFGFLWLNDGWLGLAFVLGFVYLFLTLPRWKDLGDELYVIAALPQPFYLSFEALHGPLGLPLLAHFAVVAPAVFLCITPLGATMPRFTGKAGRTFFILLALPFFLLVGSQYWPQLDRALSLIWSMLWSPIDKMSSDAVLLASVYMFLGMWARLADIGLDRRIGYVFFAVFAVRYLLEVSEPLRTYTPMVDLIQAAGIVAVCIWPGRPEADQKTTG